MSALAARVMQVLRENGAPMSQPAIRQRVGAKPGSVSSALNSLRKANKVRRDGEGRSGLYRLLDGAVSPEHQIQVQVLDRAPPQLSLPAADELRCAVFHDSTVLFEKAGAGIILTPAECLRAFEFLDQMENVWREALEA